MSGIFSDFLTARQKKMLAVYSFGHFMVDFICAFGLISLLLLPESRGLSILLLFLYNFCAFALQMPVGLISDRADRNSLFAVFGICLTLLTLILPVYHFPVAFAVLLGIGNCFYHVGGGNDVLHFGTEKQWPLGVFVSPGAFGLFLGTLLAKQEIFIDFFDLADRFIFNFIFKDPLISDGINTSGDMSLLFAAILVIAVFSFSFAALHLSPLKMPSGNGSFDIKPRICNMKWAVAAFLLFFAVVVLRSYVGMTVSFSWKTGFWALAVVAGVVLGKTCGGFLADRFGSGRASFATLLLCAVFLFFPENPVCGTLGIFLFNMTMPLTLFEMAKMFPNARGFAFGALTLALFIGFLPVLFSIPEIPVPHPVLYASEAILSMILLLTGLFIAGKAEKNENEMVDK